MTKRTIKVDVGLDVDMSDWQIQADVEGALKRAGYEPGEVEVERVADAFERYLRRKYTSFVGAGATSHARTVYGAKAAAFKQALEAYEAFQQGRDPEREESRRREEAKEQRRRMKAARASAPSICHFPAPYGHLTYAEWSQRIIKELEKGYNYEGAKSRVGPKPEEV